MTIQKIKYLIRLNAEIRKKIRQGKVSEIKSIVTDADFMIAFPLPKPFDD